MSKSQFIGVDFDGTCVTHAYPAMGEPIDNCIEVLNMLQHAGHKLILVTMRSGEQLVEAIEYLEENGIKLYSANSNPTQKHWTASPKIFCNIYIDDAGLGCPLIQKKCPIDGHDIGRPYVDWISVEEMLAERGVI